jgi:hypothetical protein
VKKICFFNHYHNGDLFHSKAFIKEIVKTIDTEFEYAHTNNPVVISDLDIPHIGIPNLSPYSKFVDSDNILYVNTWIGCYFDSNKPFNGECTLRFSYQMFGEIYEYLNQFFGSSLHLNSIEKYFPFVDYSKFDCSRIDQFLNDHSEKKILFSNGPCLSGQSHYNGDMSEIIEKCALSNPEKLFIATYKFDTNSSNIKFTSDIIQSDTCDLNEISYISKHCNLIIGRNSGPFCFSTTGENMMDPQKTFYAFGERETDCFYYDMNIECSFVFEKTSEFSDVESSILELSLKV